MLNVNLVTLVPESNNTDILKTLPNTGTDHGRFRTKNYVTASDARVKLDILSNNH